MKSSSLLRPSLSKPRRQPVAVGEAWAAYVAARSHKWGDSHKRDHEKAIQPGGEHITGEPTPWIQQRYDRVAAQVAGLVL